MGEPTTIPALLLERAAADPDRVVARVTVLGEERAISLGELAERSLAVARALGEAGLRAGDVVPLAFPTSAEYLFAVFGAFLHGAAAAPVAHLALSTPDRVRHHAERLRAVARTSGARVAVVTRETAALVAEHGGEVGPVLVAIEDLSIEASGAGYTPAPFDAETTALVQFSSGSTAEPKGVRVRYRNIAANAAAIARRSAVTPDDSMLCFLPLYHDFGFFAGVVLPVAWDVPVRLYETAAFVRRPSFWPKAMSATRSTLCPAPQFVYDVAVSRIRDRDLEGVDLSAWRVCYNGGEPIRAATLRAFNERFARYGLGPSVVLPSYGMAEATLASAIQPAGARFESDVVSRDALVNHGRAIRAADDEVALEVTSCGPPLDGFEVGILDDAGTELPERAIGEIALRGPSVADEYLVGEGETLPLILSSWFRTGDLGYLADGRVFATGRAKDLIIRGGANYYPQDVERAIEPLDGVRLNGVVAFGLLDEDGRERVVAVVETDTADRAVLDTLPDRARRAVFDALGLALDDVSLERRGWIPKTSSAKLQRARARELYRSRVT